VRGEAAHRASARPLAQGTLSRTANRVTQPVFEFRTPKRVIEGMVRASSSGPLPGPLLLAMLQNCCAARSTSSPAGSVRQLLRACVVFSSLPRRPRRVASEEGPAD
jgi:hypothetical protein